WPSSRLPLAVNLKHLLGLYSLVSFDRRLLAFTLGLASLLGVLVWLHVLARRRDRAVSPRPEDGLLVTALLFAVVYFAAPSELAGGGFVNHRLGLFPPLALLLWLGSGRWTRRVRVGAQLAGALLAIGMLATLWARWWRVDRQLDEYVAVAERIEDGRTVLPLALAPHGIERTADGRSRELAFRVSPFIHAMGYVAGRRPIVDLGLYEACEDYFPLRFRPDLDPYRHLSTGPIGIEIVPPRLDIAGYERHGGRVDYVLLWQPQAMPRDLPTGRDLYRQLDSGFDRVHVSSRGNAELWRRKLPSQPGG